MSKFQVEKRDMVLTGKALWLVGREKAKAGPNKGKLEPAVSRKIELEKISKVSLSSRQDDMVVVHVSGEHASCLEVPLKTEFITQLSKKTKDRTKKDLKLEFMEM